MSSAFESTVPRTLREVFVELAPYAVPGWPGPIDLALDANECPSEVDLAALARSLGADAAARYPDASVLERAIAERFGVVPARVLVTAGGDDAIDRACRVALAPGRDLLTTTPTFEMIGRSARIAGARVRSVDWLDGVFPTGEMIEHCDAATSLIAVVSPNNPTGSVATADDLRALSAARPDALLLVDLAYTEFADADLTPDALNIPNAVIVRTFSKAHGLAGLRVGYALGPEPLIRAMRAAGGPYPCSTLSLAAARAALARPEAEHRRTVSGVRASRAALAGTVRALGGVALDSQANFVLASFGPRTAWVWRALSALGIRCRAFPANTPLQERLRITCPGDAASTRRVEAALRAALRPEAVLFDMDGVLADVRLSYRRAVIETAAGFSVQVTHEEIARAKAEGDANNDWRLTQRLLARRGVEVDLAEVTARFERLYQGRAGEPGLCQSETLIPDPGALHALASRVPLGVVTGRPRRDCDAFLERFGIADLFPVRVCMEDAPAKPDPAPVSLALCRLGVGSAWMVGDTVDDAVAARAAGVVPIGFLPPKSADSGPDLERAGVALMLESLDTLGELLP